MSENENTSAAPEPAKPRLVPRRSFLGAGALGAGALLAGGAQSAYGATAPLVASGPGDTPLTIQGASGQYADLTRWNASDGTKLAGIDGKGGLTTYHINLDTVAQGQGVSPEMHYKATNGKWFSGIDWAAPTPARDMVVIGKINDAPDTGVHDLIYCSHNADKAPTVGIGFDIPGSEYRLQVMAELSEPAMGGLMVRAPRNQTGKAFAVRDAYSNPPNDFFAIKGDGSLEMKDRLGNLLFGIATDGSISNAKMKGDATTNRVLRFVRPTGGGYFDFIFKDSAYMQFVNTWTATPSWQVGPNGRFEPLQTIQARLTGIQLPHVGSSVPSGANTGEIRIGNGKIWVNDAGKWKSVAVS